MKPAYCDNCGKTIDEHYGMRCESGSDELVWTNSRRGFARGMKDLEERQQEMRERWANEEIPAPRGETYRFGRSNEKLSHGWLTLPGYTRDRFMAKVAGRKVNECWLWLARVDRDGYGRFSLDGKHRAAHRVAYEGTYGPVPNGLTIDHRCRNRACVNPRHLEAVPHKVNVNRGLRKLSAEIVLKSSSEFLRQIAEIENNELRM
jgi:hypothetical protein